MRKAFKSSTTQDQQVVSKSSVPNPVKEMYNLSDKPPPLNILSTYRSVLLKTQHHFTSSPFKTDTASHILLLTWSSHRDTLSQPPSAETNTKYHLYFIQMSVMLFLLLLVNAGMITRKHLSSTRIPPTSLICGKRRCCRTQRIRGKRRGSRRYKSVHKDLKHHSVYHY